LREYTSSSMAFTELFLLQNEAAEALGGALRLSITPEECRRLQQPPTANARTYKYDIIDHGRLLVLVEPEIEIYKLGP
jgi:hypothetical protein